MTDSGEMKAPHQVFMDGMKEALAGHEMTADPMIEMWHNVLDHIEAAMALVNQNDGCWSSLAQAKTSAERTLGSVLFSRARRAKAGASGSSPGGAE